MVRTQSDMAQLLFKKLDEGGEIDWQAHPRCSALLIRALHNIISADLILSKIPPARVLPRRHLAIASLVRRHRGGETQKLEERLEWQLWTVSCNIHDAQHRLAATLDRCVNYWTIQIALMRGTLDQKRQSEKKYLQDNLPPWVGTQLLNLSLLLEMQLQLAALGIGQYALDAQKVRMLSDFDAAAKRGLTTFSQLSDALHESSDTEKAAKAISFAEEHLFASEATQKRLKAVSASEFVSKLQSESDQLLSNEVCIAILQGRVNDFKHRALARTGRERHYRYHVELAITAQAFLGVATFFKSMSACLKSAPNPGAQLNNAKS